jgi:hypothetical protein
VISPRRYGADAKALLFFSELESLAGTGFRETLPSAIVHALVMTA